jgi:GTP-binding protein HflX
MFRHKIAVLERSELTLTLQRTTISLAEPKREDLKVRQRKAVLVAVVKPETANQIGKDRVLEEMKGLARTAGVKVVDTLVQVRDMPDTSTYLGKGKVEELKALVARHGADLVVFDNNLSPSQGRNLETELNTVIVDRSEVILDIFATTARTYEAKLQVELAQLLYFRNRLKRMWTHLERIEGGVGTGRGPGEKQLETDRRLIDRRISELKRRLGEVEKRRKLTVSARRDHLTVSLVGYTNAGKSTLMNALTDAGVLVADKLFATLDTRTRRWHLPHWGEVLLSDTVGFIRDLPHHLVASFRSTLEEARHADLLLHVVDASDPQAERQIATVENVLDEIGVEGRNTLLVLNKVDAVHDRSLVDVLRLRHPNAVTISARSGEGIDRLNRAVADRLADGYVEATVETGVGNGRLLAYLAEHAEVTDTQYNDSRVTLQCRIPRAFLSKLHEDDTTVTLPHKTHADGLEGIAASA